MHESAVLHFDLHHLSADQPFTLHAGLRTYSLSRHTRQSRARARRVNTALKLFPDEKITHFAGPVRLPAGCPILLRVTAPALRPDDKLDRLVLTSVHIPRRHRIAGVARRKQRPGTPPSRLGAKLTEASGTTVPIPDDQLVDIGDINTATDAAVSLVFHHPEMMALQPENAETILNIIQGVDGIGSLALSILAQSQAHEQDPTQPNWVESQASTNWQTGQPAGPIYVWSSETLGLLSLPLSNALQATKNDQTLQGQCWTVQPGITTVPATPSAAGRATLPGDGEANYTVKQLTAQSGVENSFSYDPSSNKATINLKNSYLRWLQVSVDQYSPAGQPIGSTALLGQISPVDTIMSVPLPAAWSPFCFTFSDEASSAVVSLGGLGQGPFSWSYDWQGIILTSVFNLAIPTIFIALGVAVDRAGDWTSVQKQFAGVVLTGLEAADQGLANVVTGTSSEDLCSALANCALSLLESVITGSDTFEVWITKAVTLAGFEDATPFVGWIAFAIGAAADAASIVETSVEVARSPATMTLDIVRTMDVQVTVEPDVNHEDQWPADATSYVITITYDDGPTFTYTGEMNSTTQTGPIDQTFQSLPAGGSLSVLACFYSATDWLAGRGLSPVIAAQPNQGSTLAVPAFNIVENLVPLNASTVYNFKEKLGYANSARVWLSAPVPSATVSSLDSSNVGDNLWELTSLALNEPESAVGYLWEASGQNTPLIGQGNDYSGQMFTFQNISNGSSPQSGLKYSGFGFVAKPCLAYPPPTAVNPIADGFLLEPDLSDTNMQLRALSLQAGQPFLPSQSSSFGQFIGPQDDLAIHPAGYAVALSQTNCTLQILKLTSAVPDAQAPVAAVYAGAGTRPGLLYSPVAITCTLDKILVLDAPPQYPQGCIWAFDFKGNPVACFASNQSVAPLYLECNVTVVPCDLSFESKGYIYVLKYLDNGTGTVQAGDYLLDIYNPDGSFLTQTKGLAAARLQVDLWRNIYTLDYEIVAGTGRTEPSVAFWTPSTPVS